MGSCYSLKKDKIIFQEILKECLFAVVEIKEEIA